MQWSVIECQVAIVCACLPSLRTTLLLVPFFRTSTYGSSGSRQKSPYIFGSRTNRSSHHPIAGSGSDEPVDLDLLEKNGNGNGNEIEDSKNVLKTVTYSVDVNSRSRSNSQTPEVESQTKSQATSLD